MLIAHPHSWTQTHSNKQCTKLMIILLVDMNLEEYEQFKHGASDRLLDPSLFHGPKKGMSKCGFQKWYICMMLEQGKKICSVKKH